MQNDTKESPRPPLPDATNWRELAERASKEPDPTKLLLLVHQLCDQLEQAEQRKKSVLQKDGLK
jgi:hypothetical protein